ncbi:MAG: hypothetical protein KDD56_10040 [Bdellovibrionales bacterium]|nr:hypothetical protein [Bdellovibrionales bacterium]
MKDLALKKSASGVSEFDKFAQSISTILDLYCKISHRLHIDILYQVLTGEEFDETKPIVEVTSTSRLKAALIAKREELKHKSRAKKII